MKWVDLHTHSTASDGTTAPDKLPEVILKTIEKHQQQEFYDEYIIALTDHDTVAGVERLKEVAKTMKERGICMHVIAGVELSCVYRGISIHMLGYGVDPSDEDFEEKLAFYRDSRDSRNVKIAQKFAELGIEINLNEIPVAEGESLGRPHIARYLMEMGIISSIKEGFDKYLGDGKPCYVDRERPTPAEAVGIIHRAGGQAVLAHPLQYRKLSRPELEEMISSLKEAGLDGIETYYTDFTEDEIAYIEALAQKFDLYTTGGSDYHGQNKPDCEIGYGHGNLSGTMSNIRWSQGVRSAEP